MKLQQLTDWLKNPKAEFTEGLKMLELCEPKSNRIAFFHQHENATPGTMYFEMLKAELLRLQRKFSANAALIPAGGEAVKKAEPKKIIANPIIKTKGFETSTANATDKEALKKENNAIGMQLASLGAQRKLLIKQNAPAEEISKLTVEITALEDRRNEIWAIVDDKTKIQTNSNDQKIPLVELTRKISSAKKYIQRNSKSDNPKTIEEVNNRLQFLKECEIEFQVK